MEQIFLNCSYKSGSCKLEFNLNINLYNIIIIQLYNINIKKVASWFLFNSKCLFTYSIAVYPITEDNHF